MCAKKITSQNIVFSMSNEKLKDLISKIEDLTKIDEQMSMNFDNENLLMYSLAGKESIHAFKSYIIKKSEIFDEFSGVEDNTVKFLFSDAKKLHKTLSNFKEFEDEVKVKITYNEDNLGERFLIKNSKLKLEVPGTRPNMLSKNISIEQINRNMNVDNALFSFKIGKDDFDRVKKLGSVDTTNEYYSISIKENKVSISEKSWSLDIDEIENPNYYISFPKKYFNTIKIKGDFIQIYVFRSFILILNDESNLMITVELTV